MNKFFVVFFTVTLLVVGSSLPFLSKQCRSGVTGLEKSLMSALKQDNQNKQVDQITKIVESVPQLLESCGSVNGAQLFRKQVPQVCITDLNKAGKLAVKAMEDKQNSNQVKLALDVAMLQRLFQNKLKKQCPFLEDVTLEDIKNAAQCLQSSYQISRIFQTAWQDYKTDHKKAMDEFTTGIELIPDVLTDCGHADLANKLKKYLKIQCINSAQKFVKEGVVFLHNFDKIEWLAVHAKEFLETAKELQKNCS